MTHRPQLFGLPSRDPDLLAEAEELPLVDESVLVLVGQFEVLIDLLDRFDIHELPELRVRDACGNSKPRTRDRPFILRGDSHMCGQESRAIDCSLAGLW